MDRSSAAPVFGYGGFESAVVAGSESRDPKRDTAFALISAMLAITLIYCLMQIAVVGVLPNAAASKAPVAETLGSSARSGRAYARQHRGDHLRLWLAYRLLADVAENLLLDGGRHELPSALEACIAKFRTPYVAIIVNSAIGLGLGLASNFGQLATFGAISRLGIYIATCAALIALRKKRGEPEGFRAPGGIVLAVIGIAFCIWLLSTRSLAQAWFLPIVILLGLAVCSRAAAPGASGDLLRGLRPARDDRDVVLTACIERVLKKHLAACPARTSCAAAGRGSARRIRGG